VTSPFRGDVVVTGFLLAIPVFLLAMRGEFTADEVITRLLWCLGAGWVAVALVRWASTPPPAPRTSASDVPDAAEPEGDVEPAPTA
jgi:hypothetical protein